MLRMQSHLNDRRDILRAKALRKAASIHEQALWNALQENGSVNELKFRRQQPLHPYILDFVCMKAKLVIELDGDSHDLRQVYDKKREHYLQKQGFSILRFSNSELRQNLSGVVIKIIEEAKKLITKQTLEKEL